MYLPDAYGSKEFNDEFFWAASELYVSTADKKYLSVAIKYQRPWNFLLSENWRQYLRNLGYFRLADDASPLPPAEKEKYRKAINCRSRYPNSENGKNSLFCSCE